MIPYILHVALLISVCLLFYKLLLQKETFYRLNRIILVCCLALAFILPLIPIPQQWALQIAPKPAETVQQPVVTVAARCRMFRKIIHCRFRPKQNRPCR